ncbi:MAG TPA: T9SS type A sorting domain-containing protein [Bacteroidia bacterium]|nr:T9SS type A sorting domain-containing protein [Bacteroidia bacterium]
MSLRWYKLVFPLAIALPCISFSQSNLWYLTRGLSTGEVAWAVDVDSIGNIYWAVEEKDIFPYWYYSIVLYKIDSSAQQNYQAASWGWTFNDIAFKATVKAPDVYLSGRADSTGNPVSGDALVASFNMSNGNFNWAYSYNPVPDYGYEEIDGLIVQPDGIYLSGWKQQQNTNDMDFLVQKINFAGQLVWSSTWDYNSLGKFDGANGHMAMDANFIYAAGHVNKSNIIALDGDAALVCFSRSNGAYQWNVTWGGIWYDDALGMTMSSDSMLYVTGYTGSFGNGSQNYLNKYTRSGQLLWSKIWGGTGTEDSRSLVTDGDSAIYVVGATSSYGNGQKDIFVLKYDTSGTLLDSLFWGGAHNETAKDVAMSDAYLYITGETESFGNGQINGDHQTDGLLLKINGRTMQAPDTLTNIFDNGNYEDKLFVYPNPSNGDFYIHYSGVKIQNAELKIYDVFGKETFQSNISNLTSHIASALTNGIYFLRITSGNSSFIQKIIIHK